MAPKNTAFTEFGYGRTSVSNPPPDGLQKSPQGDMMRIDCPNFSAGAWTSGHLCVDSSASTSWGGDSGSPLLWWRYGYWQQVGSLTGIPPDPEGKARPTVRYFWSEADGDTRNWILSYVFSTVGSNGFSRGTPPSAETILRDRDNGTRWLYTSDGYRHLIPDDGVYNCLVESGKQVLNLPLRTIEALPDMVGSHASCTPRPAATVTSAPAATVTPSTHTPPTVTPFPPHPYPTPTPAPASHPVNAYNNYNTGGVGHAMCRGNPYNSLSMPGGTASQTFTVPAGVASLNGAKVQIDPDATVTAHLSVAVNGTVVATTTAVAAGDTYFTFGPVSVHAGDTVRLSIVFSATSGKIITVYTVGNPGGTFTASNSCPDGAPNVSTTSTGLRAVVSGMS